MTALKPLLVTCAALLLGPTTTSAQPHIQTPPQVRTRSVDRPYRPLGPGEPVSFTPRDAHSTNLSVLRKAITLAGFTPNDRDARHVACVGVASGTGEVDPSDAIMAALRETFGDVIRPQSACGNSPPDSSHPHPFVVETSTRRPGIMIWTSLPRIHPDWSYSMWTGYHSGFNHSAMYQCRLERSPRGPEVVWCELRGVA